MLLNYHSLKAKTISCESKVTQMGTIKTLESDETETNANRKPSNFYTYTKS